MEIGAFFDETVVTGVNDDGVVTGYGYPLGMPGHGASLLSHPFYWRAGKSRGLPTLGGRFGKAQCISSRGDIAGAAESRGGTRFPVIWPRTAEYAAHQLDQRPGSAILIQDDGTVLGYVRDQETWSFVSWKDGRCQELLKSMPTDATIAGVDAKGILYGSTPDALSIHSRPLFDLQNLRRAVSWKNGKRSLLTTKFSLGACTGVNAAGQAVGWVEQHGGMLRRAASWRSGKLDLLPTPTGYQSEATAVNAWGDTVGECDYFADDGKSHQFAALWRGGRLHDLNSLVPKGSKWELTSPTAISNRGLIVGTGWITGERGESHRPFLLRPER